MCVSSKAAYPLSSFPTVTKILFELFFCPLSYLFICLFSFGAVSFLSYLQIRMRVCRGQLQINLNASINFLKQNMFEDCHHGPKHAKCCLKT